jgi:hypothetical protein
MLMMAKLQAFQGITRLAYTGLECGLLVGLLAAAASLALRLLDPGESGSGAIRQNAAAGRGR